MPWNGTMLGYSYEKGKYIVVPDEAALVKLIYEYYLDGLGYNAVAKRLSAEGYKTSNGKPWYHSTIMKILRNYTYTGNLLLQKTYRENHITKKTLVNRGELPMYHAENTHEAIISQETAVQSEIARRADRFEKVTTPKATYPFSGKLVRGICGKNYRRKVTHAGLVWICSTYNEFTVEFLQKKMKPNEGEVPQYYVEASHPAIIEPDEWDQVQAEFAHWIYLCQWSVWLCGKSPITGKPKPLVF